MSPTENEGRIASVAESFINRYSSERATLNALSSASPHSRAHRGCSCIIESAVVVQRRGKVAYSFVATRCIVSSREEKNRGGRAQWPSRWSRQVVYGAGTENKVSRLSTGSEKSAAPPSFSFGAPSVDLLMHHQFTTSGT